MPAESRSKLKCFLLAPLGADFDEVRHAIRLVARDHSIALVSVDENFSASIVETIYSEIAKADIVVAVVSGSNPNVFYEVGLAQATGKPVIFVIDDAVGTPLLAAKLSRSIYYNDTSKGLERLQTGLARLFESLKREPTRLKTLSSLTARSATLPIVDLDRLEPREFENLCFELLTHMGFTRMKWGEQLKEIDAVATLPKKDPDGFEYNELWLISMGLHAPTGMLLEMAMEPDYLVHRLVRPGFLENSRSPLKLDMPITLLVIQFRDDPSIEMLQQELRRAELRSRKRGSQYTLRIRHWDRQQLVQLIRQFPQIANKYFSEDGRAQSKFRKTSEQLYLENAALNEKNQATIAALEEEHNKRVRAERDAVWKDVAFTAAHKLGNPIFALETDLQSLRRRIASKPDEALEVTTEMDVSIEKAKSIIEQFKSLTKAQQIEPRSIDLLPLLRNSARVATDNGVDVQFSSGKPPPLAFADPTRMTECFDELFANALHWLNKPKKQIVVRVDTPAKKGLPSDLDSRRRYVRIRFEDNGTGVPSSKKEEIFAPFYTTYPHGTGLGLSLVQRVVEGHGGIVREIGKAGEGATFEIFLPRDAAMQKE